MTKKQRIEAFVQLGEYLRHPDAEFTRICTEAAFKNPWYTTENVQRQCQAIAQQLNTDSLTTWLATYPDVETPLTVGLILAGNIPLVGFHDVLCTLIAGCTAKIKLSSDDAGLTSTIIQQLLFIEPAFAPKIAIIERLEKVDVIIATGSNNSFRYFDYYFGKKPHIIRKNRNSVAVIQGNETPEQMNLLGHDIFDYFGLGCRSISKVYVPKGYDVKHFFEGIAAHEPIKNHYKYANNYDYNKSIYLINGEQHFDNGFVLLKKDERLASPLAVVFYEEYEHQADLEDQLQGQAAEIQCITAQLTLNTDIPTFPFGVSQSPTLTDYADGVDTLAFLFAQQV